MNMRIFYITLTLTSVANKPHLYQGGVLVVILEDRVVGDSQILEIQSETNAIKEAESPRVYLSNGLNDLNRPRSIKNTQNHRCGIISINCILPSLSRSSIIRIFHY